MTAIPRLGDPPYDRVAEGPGRVGLAIGVLDPTRPDRLTLFCFQRPTGRVQPPVTQDRATTAQGIGLEGLQGLGNSPTGAPFPFGNRRLIEHQADRKST